MKKFNLDDPLLEIATKHGKSVWTVRDALESTQVFGSTGAGKSSAVGKTIACKMLSAEFSGLVLCAKATEAEDWIRYARSTGRENDVIIISPNHKNYFNFLDYEMNSGPGQLMTDNILDMLKTVMSSGDNDSSRDTFWTESLDQLATQILELSFLAYGTVSVEIMFDIISTIPKDKADLEAGLSNGMQKPFFMAFERARQRVDALAHEWFNKLDADKRANLDTDEKVQEAIVNAIPEARALKYVDMFFVDVYVNLAEKTKSILNVSFGNFLHKLLREPAYSLFCRYPSNVAPEDCFSGKVIILDLPLKLYHKVGLTCQLLCKYLFQRAFERRKIDDYSRCVFIWSDEAHLFLVENDQAFQTTCRASRVAVVSITQNLASYYAQLGGQKSHDKVTSLLGTFNTKFFMNNADVQTNQYASSLIGEDYFEDISSSINKGRDFSEGRSSSYRLEKLVRAEAFGQLKTGGPKNNFIAEAYMHRQGDRFASGYNHQKVSFTQLLD